MGISQLQTRVQRIVFKKEVSLENKPLIHLMKMIDCHLSIFKKIQYSLN